MYIFFFFFNDTATTEIYTLSLHDALPICGGGGLHELALLLELGEHGLAVDTELLGEFVYAGFAWHGSPLCEAGGWPARPRRQYCIWLVIWGTSRLAHPTTSCSRRADPRSEEHTSELQSR